MFCFCLSNWILSFCPYCTYSSIITLITFGHIRVNSVTCIWSIHRNGYHQYQTLPQVTGVAPPSSFKTSHYFRGVPRRCHTYEHSPCRFSHNVCLTFWFLNVFVLMAFYHVLLKWLHLEWGEKRICLQCRRPEFDSWVGKIPWWRKWLPTPVLLLGWVHGQRSLVSYSPRGRKELDMTESLTISLSCLKINFLNDHTS